MSVCTFIASDFPLAITEPVQDYPLEINIDEGTIYDGGAEYDFHRTLACVVNGLL